MARRRLVWRLYPTYLLVIVLCTVGVGLFAGKVTRSLYYTQTEARLEVTARLVAQAIRDRVPDLRPEQVQALCRARGAASGVRLTVILRNGKVIGESDRDPEGMEDHSKRPEILSAYDGGVGKKIRPSPTLGVDMMYLAVPLTPGVRDGPVVRASVPLSDIAAALEALYGRILLGGVAVAVSAAVLGWVVARRLSRPLGEMAEGADRFAQGNLAHRVPVPETKELAHLAEAMNRMAAQLSSTIDSLTRERGEREAILASMVEGVVAVDRDGRILRVNRAAGRLLGIDPATATGQSLEEAIRLPALHRLARTALELEEPAEDEFVRREEGEQFLQVRCTRLRQADGREMGVLVVLRDVTHLRRLQTVRRDFVANVSHELNTPITSIRGFVETLREGGAHDPEKAARFLDIISRQANRLTTLIEDLLALSRIESDDEAGRVERVRSNLRPVLDDAAQDCAEMAAERGVRVVVRCPDPLWAPVSVLLIQQAVGNLLDNAIKYSDAGGKVVVEAEETGDGIHIRVRDQGYGIAAEHLPRLFERFYRADKGRSRDLGGTGLGLAIVKHIAQAHGGSVSVESTPGKGSVFTICLPAA